jgi:DNA-binding transcriptional regulator YdaS (Cro superfamily)
MNIHDYFSSSPNGGLTQTQLSEALGVSLVLVNQWVHGYRPVPVKYAMAIEQATGGKVSRQDICQDWARYWPDLEAA